MREDDGRRLDHATLETLRIRAVKQIEAGAHPEEVARAWGMARGTVYGWVAKYRQGGLGALRAKPIPGRPAKLTGQQVRRLYTLVVGADPRQLQFDFALWTREMIRELIRREFGVSLSVVSIGRLLTKLGLSAQRPLYRVYQQNPEAVEEFTTRTYPTRCAPRPRPRAPPSTSPTRPASAATTTLAPPGHRADRPPWSRPPAPGTAST